MSEYELWIHSYRENTVVAIHLVSKLVILHLRCNNKLEIKTLFKIKLCGIATKAYMTNKCAAGRLEASVTSVGRLLQSHDSSLI